MKLFDLETRPILPETEMSDTGTPPKIELDAFWMGAGSIASSCTPSNCSMFTPNQGDRPNLESESSYTSDAEI
ncbi:MAG: hypothetical protein HC919_04555 [Oscillatoriales cyanobacterium SM2_2_1]|nr:hypothetical protein [Oscillatoriales cyanobacterium SM2_2_1]